MQGWMYLPRYIDKLRLQLAGKLDPDYEPFLGKNTDALWLKAAGLTHEQMLGVVKDSLTDGQVCMNGCARTLHECPMRMKHCSSNHLCW